VHAVFCSRLSAEVPKREASGFFTLGGSQPYSSISRISPISRISGRESERFTVADATAGFSDPDDQVPPGLLQVAPDLQVPLSWTEAETTITRLS
jgi:hypothetical protein